MSSVLPFFSPRIPTATCCMISIRFSLLRDFSLLISTLKPEVAALAPLCRTGSYQYSCFCHGQVGSSTFRPPPDSKTADQLMATSARYNCWREPIRIFQSSRPFLPDDNNTAVSLETDCLASPVKVGFGPASRKISIPNVSSRYLMSSLKRTVPRIWPLKYCGVRSDNKSSFPVTFEMTGILGSFNCTPDTTDSKSARISSIR